MEGWIVWAPWTVVGVIAIIGGITVMTAGMPWQTKREADLRAQLIDQKFVTVDEKISRVTELTERNAQAISELAQSVKILLDRDERGRVRS